jgi:hypothetical protein
MKRLLVMIVCAAFIHSSEAQFGLRSLNSSNQQLIEEAVKDGLFIVRQSYLLKDSVTSYGWDNMPNFGTTYSLGVKVADGYYLADQVVHPWKYDSKFDEFCNNKQYKPIISQTEYLSYNSLKDSIFLPFLYQPNCVGKQIYLVSDSLFENKGFAVDKSDNVKQGWLVWLVSTDSLEKITHESLSLLVYRNELKSETGTYNIEAPTTNKIVVGGIYIVPKVESIGKLTFYLSGIAHKEGDDWQIVRLGESKTGTPEQGIADQVRNAVQSKSKGLTPIKSIRKSN